MNPNHAKLADLDEAEVEAIDNSMRKDELVRRTRGIILSTLVVVGGVVIFLGYGFGPVFLALLTLGTLVVSAAEKITYQRRMLHYESVIRKLLARVRTDAAPNVNDLAKHREPPTVPPPSRSDLPRDVARENLVDNARFNNAQYSAHESGAHDRPDRASGNQPHTGHGFDSDWSGDARIARHAVTGTK